jgi:hypothetical protein
LFVDVHNESSTRLPDCNALKVEARWNGCKSHGTSTD